VSNHRAAAQHLYDATTFAPFTEMVPPIGHEDWLISRPTSLREGGTLHSMDMFGCKAREFCQYLEAKQRFPSNVAA